MRAGHDNIVRVSIPRLGKDVVRGGDAAEGIRLQAQHESRRGGQLLANSLGHRCHGDIESEGVAQGSIHVAGDIVIDHDANRARAERVGRFDRKRARTAAD